VVVVTVEDLDVDAGLGHTACEKAKLARHTLLQALDKDVPLREDADAPAQPRASPISARAPGRLSKAMARSFIVCSLL